MTDFNQIGDIDNTTTEGRYLLMAIAKISTESQTDKTPEEILSQIKSLVDNVYPVMQH